MEITQRIRHPLWHSPAKRMDDLLDSEWRGDKGWDRWWEGDKMSWRNLMFITHTLRYIQLLFIAIERSHCPLRCYYHSVVLCAIFLFFDAEHQPTTTKMALRTSVNLLSSLQVTLSQSGVILRTLSSELLTPVKSDRVSFSFVVRSLPSSTVLERIF